ncbi:MAG TPA: energy transducer TonB [Rhizomicrobium sp.]|jgi:hypothetical protein|nr:energy transducer TonB [Rhizomicrobium sp.]
MRKFGRWAGALPFVAILFAATAMADDIPSYQVLECESGCPQITPPVKVSHENPPYPANQVGFRNVVGAMVDASYTIGTDGHVKNIVIVRLVGPQDFADTVTLTLQGWEFEPAKANGQPVEQNETARFLFEGPALHHASDAVIAEYKKAMALIESGKTAEGVAALKAIAAEPELNFFERCMVAYSLALLDVQAANYPDALSQMNVATVRGGLYLADAVRADALRLQIRLEAANGDTAEAFGWYETLRREKFDVSGDETAQLIARLHAMIHAPDPLVTEAKMDTSFPQPYWRHTLMRRAFAFSAIKGKLDGFDLICAHNHIQSAVSDTAQWTVPKSWSHCQVAVTGSADATFQFIELRPAP